MKTMSLREAVARHPEFAPVPPPPVSVRKLMQHFQPVPPGSLEALLIKMGPFKPERDAFRFDNSFKITEENVKAIREHLSSATEGVVNYAVAEVKGILDRIKVTIPIIPAIPLIHKEVTVDFGIPNTIVQAVLNAVSAAMNKTLGTLFDKIAGSSTKKFGRCGGMAFAGYDFYLLDWTVDERLGKTPPDTGALGNYIFERLLNSLDQNVGTFLLWLADLNLMQDILQIAQGTLGAEAGSFAGEAAGGALGALIGGAIGAYLAGNLHLFDCNGTERLRDRTKDEWMKIKNKLDEQAAWPIGLIYSDSQSPTDQHQVLAIGYTDNGNGTGSLKVWDNNDGAKPRTWQIDFTGKELMVSNSDRPLKGIFLEKYTPQNPPRELQLI